MRLKDVAWTTALVVTAILLTAVISTASLNADGAGGAEPTSKAGKAAQVARGKYLVDIMGCHDCHTPMKMGPKGPEWDMTRALSGHPEELVMPPWITFTSSCASAWVAYCELNWLSDWES